MTMLLQGRNDREFELALIEDRFPEVQDDAADSAWVTLSFRVGTPEETWEETAPCLNVYEIRNLAEWLEGVAEGKPEVGELDLLEPNLNFSIEGERGSEVTIRVNFNLEARPERYGVDAPADQDHIEIRLGRDQVRTAAAELRRDLETITAGRGRPGAARDESESGIFGEPEEDLGLSPDDIAGRLDEGDDDRMF